MRGMDEMQEPLFTTVKLEDFVPADHPLRPLRLLVNQAEATRRTVRQAHAFICVATSITGGAWKFPSCPIAPTSAAQRIDIAGR